MPKATFQLARFRAFLTSNEGLSEKTTDLYVSMVRGFLRTQTFTTALLADPERLRKLALEHDAALASNSRGTFRTALRAFLRFAEAATGRSVAQAVDFPDRRRADVRREEREALKEPPNPLTELLRELEKADVPLQHVEFMRWRDVSRPAMTEKAQLHDRKNHRLYLVPIELMRRLSLWAGDGKPAPSDFPLVPIAPNVPLPMVARRLRYLADRPIFRNVATPAIPGVEPPPPAPPPPGPLD